MGGGEYAYTTRASTYTYTRDDDDDDDDASQLRSRLFPRRRPLLRGRVPTPQRLPRDRVHEFRGQHHALRDVIEREPIALDVADVDVVVVVVAFQRGVVLLELSALALRVRSFTTHDRSSGRRRTGSDARRRVSDASGRRERASVGRSSPSATEMDGAFCQQACYRHCRRRARPTERFADFRTHRITPRHVTKIKQKSAESKEKRRKRRAAAQQVDRKRRELVPEQPQQDGRLRRHVLALSAHDVIREELDDAAVQLRRHPVLPQRRLHRVLHQPSVRAVHGPFFDHDRLRREAAGARVRHHDPRVPAHVRAELMQPLALLVLRSLAERDLQDLVAAHEKSRALREVLRAERVHGVVLVQRLAHGVDEAALPLAAFLLRLRQRDDLVAARFRHLLGVTATKYCISTPFAFGGAGTAREGTAPGARPAASRGAMRGAGWLGDGATSPRAGGGDVVSRPCGRARCEWRRWQAISRPRKRRRRRPTAQT
eukprot:31484-Pelagococcus_subviridis.AAC.16